ncbi:DinB family protein [Chondrinema litorale]|uniref:DinB family protein n=1 Tax=Chondrinema litorale TaxID=2994555 RepID=UPI002543573E|nr:DinB family protein [Chondrinema litorale]UZR98205.1 DinB family protein [Chondrinema litorale]
MNLIETLKETKIQTLTYFNLDDESLNKTYGPGKWNVKQILHHLADTETVLYDRLRRVISEPKQVIWGFNQDLWCKELDYNNLPLDLSKNNYSAVRESVIYLVQKYYDVKGHKSFIHSETGLKTLKEEMEKIAWHNQHHLKHINQALS